MSVLDDSISRGRLLEKSRKSICKGRLCSKGGKVQEHIYILHTIVKATTKTISENRNNFSKSTKVSVLERSSWRDPLSE